MYRVTNRKTGKSWDGFSKEQIDQLNEKYPAVFSCVEMIKNDKSKEIIKEANAKAKSDK